MHATLVYCLSETGRRVALEKGLPAQRVQSVHVDVPDDCKSWVTVDTNGKGWVSLADYQSAKKVAGDSANEFVSVPQSYSVKWDGRVEKKTGDLDSPIENPSEYLSALKIKLDKLKAEAEAEAEAVRKERAEAEAERNAKQAEESARYQQAQDAKRKREAEAEREKLEWIEKHGSNRLKRMIKEEIDCESVYRDERLAADRPGWAWSRDCDGSYADPRNVPEEAFTLLDKARETEPEAELVYWSVENEVDPMGYSDYGEEPEKYAWTGYAAVSEFLDREIVFGLPEEFTD